MTQSTNMVSKSSRTSVCERPGRRRNSCKKPIIEALPMDLLIEVAVRLVSTSSAPLEDLDNFTLSCKEFYEASKDVMIRRCVSLEETWSKNWWSEEMRVSFLRRCSLAGNDEADFILGMEKFYAMRDVLGLWHLKRAAGNGHPASKYALGITLFRASSSRQHAMQLLNQLESGDRLVETCRERVAYVFGKINVRRSFMIRRRQCSDVGCGEVVSREGYPARYWREEGVHRRFCSRVCRWNFEYNTLVKISPIW